MKSRIRRLLAALTVTGVLVGGGAAIAHAQTASPSPSSSSSSSGTTHNSTNCPNM